MKWAIVPSGSAVNYGTKAEGFLQNELIFMGKEVWVEGKLTIPPHLFGFGDCR